MMSAGKRPSIRTSPTPTPGTTAAAARGHLAAERTSLLGACPLLWPVVPVCLGRRSRRLQMGISIFPFPKSPTLQWVSSDLRQLFCGAGPRKAKGQGGSCEGSRIWRHGHWSPASPLTLFLPPPLGFGLSALFKGTSQGSVLDRRWQQFGRPESGGQGGRS